jgi:hypothetical protein
MKSPEFKANVPLMLDFVSRSVIHRLNFPKREAGGTATSDLAKLSPKARAGAESRLSKASLGNKSRPLLSPEDCAEVRAICAEALTATRAFELGKLSGLSWLACFKAARVTLGMNRRWQPMAGNAEAVLAEMIIPLANPEREASRRAHLARRAAFMRSCLLAVFQSDKSRKRRAFYRGKIKTLSAILQGTLRHRGMSHAEIDSTGKAVARLIQAVAEGEALLSAEAQAEALARSKRPASGYTPLDSLSSRKLPKFRPGLHAALGFNP